MALRKFSADVLWWDSSEVHVQCPFCGQIHKNSFGGGYDDIRRASHCNMGASFRIYSLKYPFSQNPEWSTYEIDKDGKRYVAVGASPPQPKRDFKQDLLVGAVAGMKLGQEPTISPPSWEDATETVSLSFLGSDLAFDIKRIHDVSRRTRFGDVDYLRQYLNSSPEKNLFIHGVDNEGKTALLLAARERYPAIIRLLLARGADPNRRTKEGRTPLM